MGWIMGPWTVVGGGAMGATLVFTEGAPDFPPDRLWRIVEEERVSVLCCSPTLIRSLIPHGEPEADLSSLRVIVRFSRSADCPPTPRACGAPRTRPLACTRSSTAGG